MFLLSSESVFENRPLFPLDFAVFVSKYVTNMPIIAKWLGVHYGGWGKERTVDSGASFRALNMLRAACICCQ